MESKPQNRLLEVPPGAIESIRKIYNLDQPGRLEEAINILEEWILKQDHILKKDFSKFSNKLQSNTNMNIINLVISQLWMQLNTTVSL